MVGGQGTGTLTHSRRRHGDQWRRLRRMSAGSNGTVTVTGPGSRWINGPAAGSISAVSARARSRSRTGGGSSISPSNAANIGNAAGSQGTVTVTGAGSRWINDSGGQHRQPGHRHVDDCGRRHCHRAYCDRDECRCDWNTQHRRGRWRSGGCTRHDHCAARRIWRRHRCAELQSHVRRLRVCARDQRQWHCQCARRHHHAHRCQHLQRRDECERGHVARRRAGHVQSEFGGDGSRAAERSISTALARPSLASPIPAS